MTQAASARPGEIPGYTYGTAAVPRAPVTLEELELLKKTLLFTAEDAHWLRISREVLAPHVEELLDAWYGFVGSHPHLLHYFTRVADGQPDGDYLAAVRKRFGQWVLDTAAANYDQAWLDYQIEIGRRHHRSGKNRTDGVGAVEHIHYRYLPALMYPIVTTLKPFLGRKGHSAEEVEKMWHAWVKSVILQVTLWSYPYVRDGDF
ncbi:MAG: protoglobin domain-containing protein [Bryobacteraceae bacterium]